MGADERLARFIEPMRAGIPIAEHEPRLMELGFGGEYDVPEVDLRRLLGVASVIAGQKVIGWPVFATRTALLWAIFLFARPRSIP